MKNLAKKYIAQAKKQVPAGYRYLYTAATHVGYQPKGSLQTQKPCYGVGDNTSVTGDKHIVIAIEQDHYIKVICTPR